MSYYEVRMINGDLFKAVEPPEKWHEKRIIEEIPGKKCGNYFLTCAQFTDQRNGKPVMVNTDHIVSIREVTDSDDGTVGLIADDQFIEDTKNLTMNILGSIFGGSQKKDDVITIENHEDEEVNSD